MWFVGAAMAQTLALYWPRAAPAAPEGIGLDKVAHVALFAVVAYAGTRANVRQTWLIGLLLGQAVLSEMVQGLWLTQRSGDGWDVIADVAGIALGIGIARHWGGRASAASDPVTHQANDRCATS